MNVPPRVLILAVSLALGLGLLLPPIVYWAGYTAGQRAADQDAVFRAMQQMMTQGIRVVALRDTVVTLKQQLARQATQRLDPRVRDSLRVARWTSP